MNSLSGISVISERLTRWYKIHQRTLPWRENPTPYNVWLSEIILQQTRIDQGLPYFNRIKERFPDVFSLAGAPEQELLLLWQGLGYYSRARNLHTTAKTIVSVYKGQFPDSYEELLKLKGVGEYTAAAIASIAFNLPHAVVDGNVFRVLSRLFNDETPVDSTHGKKHFTHLANALLAGSAPSIHNQAMMEFGAMQCTPVKPDCNACPLSDLCLAYASGHIQERPVKTGKIKRTNRYLNYLVFNYDERTWIQKRNENDIWKNLWEFPLIETPETVEALTVLQMPEIQFLSDTPYILQNSIFLKHELSHRILFAQFIPIKLTRKPDFPDNWTECSIHELDQYPFPKLIDKFFKQNNW